MNRDLPKCGEVWKHFKNQYYYILAIGHHSESNEKLVVYQKIPTELAYTVMDKARKVNIKVDDPCIRPLEMFMSEVDHVKYPKVEQQYRFERIDKING